MCCKVLKHLDFATCFPRFFMEAYIFLQGQQYMTDEYEFGGVKFVSAESDLALREVIHALDMVEVRGHRVYRTYHSILLERKGSWWTVSFEHMHQVQPVFSRILSGGNKKVPQKRSVPNKERVLGPTKRARARIMKTLSWIQQTDRKLFPPDGDVDVSIPEFREMQVFHVPAGERSFYGLTDHGIYRVVESESDRLVEFYGLTEDRVSFVESLIPGRSSEYSPVREWLMVSDYVT